VLTLGLQRIQQVEHSKQVVREAEQAAKRVRHDVANQVHPLLVLVYSELSTAEFAAKDALQKRQADLATMLVHQGYEEARNKAYQQLKAHWRELWSAMEARQAPPQAKGRSAPRTAR